MAVATLRRQTPWPRGVARPPELLGNFLLPRGLPTGGCTALVGDFSKAVLFDRQSLSITLGTIIDQFVRNMITVLGEIWAGFGVIRPSAL